MEMISQESCLFFWDLIGKVNIHETMGHMFYEEKNSSEEIKTQKTNGWSERWNGQSPCDHSTFCVSLL